MARLVPEDFPLSEIEDSEKAVVRALLSSLDDDWLVLPRVPVIVDRTDSEIDVVLVHPARSMVALEVKGGQLSLRAGAWFQNGRLMDKNPVEQAMKGKHALVRRIKPLVENLPFIAHGVVFPDAHDCSDDWLGPDLRRDMVLTGPELQWAERALDGMARPERKPLTPDSVTKIIRALRPDAEFSTEDGVLIRVVSRRLNHLARDVISYVVNVDCNQRLVVTGPAGSGKTYLATIWARRAVARGERVLFTCFNRPIAGAVADRVEPSPSLTVRNFHELALALLEPLGFTAPSESPEREWWEETLPAALRDSVQAIGSQYDTVIIDEAQDFHPSWIEALEGLLDPAGPGRLFVLGDPAQSIYSRGWKPDPSAMRVPLDRNCRNTRQIAEAVRGLGGGAPFDNTPDGPAVLHLPARGMKEVRKRIRDDVATLVEQGVPLSRIAVLTTRSKVRDELLDQPPEGLPLARWEERDEDHALCETVHRSKGLEFVAVYLVNLEEKTDRPLLYTGATRAIWWLRTVGTDSMALNAGSAHGLKSFELT